MAAAKKLVDQMVAGSRVAIVSISLCHGFTLPLLGVSEFDLFLDRPTNSSPNRTVPTVSGPRAPFQGCSCLVA